MNMSSLLENWYNIDYFHIIELNNNYPKSYLVYNHSKIIPF